MKKKILSLAVIAAMLAAVLSGCTADDVALYKALQNEPETSVTTMNITYDVTLEEPFKVVNNYVGADDAPDFGNYLLGLCGGLLSLVNVDATVTKSGDVQEVKLAYKLPDASANFNSWVKTNEDGSAQVAYALPSYLKPFLPRSLSGKQYLSVNSNDVLSMLLGLYSAQSMAAPVHEPDLGVIGGADGPTAIFMPETQNDFAYTAIASPSKTQLPMALITAALEDEKVINQLASVIDVSLVTEARHSGGGTVYTVKFDAASLRKLAHDVISTLQKPELASVMGLLTGMPVGPVDFDGAIELPDETEEFVDMICGYIADSGLLDNGLEMAITVNSQGYVTNVDESFELYFDAAKIWDALINLMANDAANAEDIAAAKAAMTVSGKFKLAVKAVSQVADINRPVTVNFPQLTEENSIDYINDFNEITQYYAEKSKFENGWNSYSEIADYARAHEPGEPLVLRNNDTGVEVTTMPITTADIYPDDDFMSVYVPLTDIAAVIPGINYSWNGDLMGVEVMYYNTFGNRDYVLYPTEAGAEVYLNAVYGEDGNDYNEDTVYSNYDFVDTYGLFYNGVFYVEYDFFNHGLGYSSRFEDGKYCYTAAANAKFQGEEPNGNLFYELAKMFQ